MEGTSSVRGRNGSEFYVSFGDEIVAQGDVEYARPLWGNVLIALITGEIKDSTISRESQANDRIVILDRDATPLISIEEPYGTVEGELRHIVQLSPRMIYTLANDRYRDEQTQSMLFLNRDLPFKPKVKELFTWRVLENSEIKSTRNDDSFAPVLNPKILWSRELDKIDPLVTQDRLYFTTLREDAPDVFSAVDKLTGRELFSYALPVKVARISLDDQKGYAVTDETLVVVGKNSLHFLQLADGRLKKTVSFEELAGSLNIPFDRAFNYTITDVLSYNNKVLFGKIFYEREGQEAYLLAFDPNGNILWTYNQHVKTEAGKNDRNGRYRYLQFLNDEICLVKKNDCYWIDLQSGKHVEPRSLSGIDLENDLSGKGQVYPAAVWLDKRKGDNYFKPKMIHKDNHYVLVKGLSRLWALGEDGLYDFLRRSQKLSESAIAANLPVKDESTPLMRALKSSQTDTVAALLDTPGLDLNAVDENGRTALYHAVALGDLRNVKILLERKVRADTVSKDGKTLLHAAFEPKPGRLSSDPADVELVKVLATRKDIDINKEDKEGITPMMLAIDHDQPEIVKLFLARTDLDTNKRTASGDYLNRAIRHSGLHHGYEIAMMLLDRDDIDVNIPYSRGETLVHMGWYNSGMGEKGLDLARKILSRQPDLNREDEYGETPLVHNINQNRPEMVRLLAGTKGVDLNRLVRDEDRTPLGHARYIKNQEMIDILQKAGAREFNFVGNEEQTPEGIPQTLLQSEIASRAIVFYRGYLLSTTEKTLAFLHEKKIDDAVRLQEFILDEIVAEMGDSFPKYSVEQRKRAISTFTAIRDHYLRYPRTGSAWFKALSADKKAAYEKLDGMRDEILNGKYDAMPDGELVTHPPMVPILILRDYMARNSTKTLGMMKKDNTAKAEVFLKEIIKRSDQTGSFSRK